MENKFYFFAVGAAYGGQRCNNNYSKFLSRSAGWSWTEVRISSGREMQSPELT